MTQKTIFELELDSNWVYLHHDDQTLPIAKIEEKLSNQNVQIIHKTLISLTFVRDDASDLERAKEHFLQLVSECFPSEEMKEYVHLDAHFFTDPEHVLDKLTDDHADEDGEYISLEDETDEKTRTLAKIDALVGANEFKALAHEIADVSDEIIRRDAHEIFRNQCYLFSIGDGCGLTTYLKLFDALLTHCDLAYTEVDVREIKLEPYRESSEPFDSALLAIGSGSKKSQRIVCVDISEWMNHTDNHFFKDFLRNVEKKTNGAFVIFRVPFVEKDILSRITYSLSDLLTVRTVTFPPFRQEELQQYAVGKFKEYGFTVKKTAWKYFFNRISEEKSDGKFYGLNTVKKVIQEITYKKHLANAPLQRKSNQITENDVKKVCNLLQPDHLSAMEQLDKLVGIEEVKKKVTEIVAQIEVSLQDNLSRPCIHMRFVGNPGTGKTTVARIVGNLLKEKGILRVGAFFEYGGRDFCGRYVGETAPKTASMCRDAYGSVLFIDEAYTLYHGDSDEKDFGREVLDTLVAEMENHRTDFVVIMAGYTDEMNKMVKGNSGIASRMPYTVEFPNYTRTQLYDIFVSIVKDHYRYQNDLFDSARGFFLNLPEQTISAKEFSNARFVRNLVERTYAKAAMRCQLTGEKTTVLKREDFEQASFDKEFCLPKTVKAKIGF